MIPKKPRMAPRQISALGSPALTTGLLRTVGSQCRPPSEWLGLSGPENGQYCARRGGGFCRRAEPDILRLAPLRLAASVNPELGNVASTPVVDADDIERLWTLSRVFVKRDQNVICFKIK